ncbi:MAG: 3'(2'),5'-bisphosphate nucleotidase CysQ, partial [Alphaproteobacteria bacterium]|nr:3'(2'),5'-bisphosphate nucleotidase CysQ [Alphaproteobacteria bacterium]
MSALDDKNAVAFEFARICSLASVKIMEIYETDFETRGKDDRSPVTDADELAEEIILAALETAFPGTPVLAEESFAAGFRPKTDGAFILVDPVDGTKEFINKNGEFTVNIALVENREPTAGCVYAPARERIFIGGTKA